MKQSPTLSNGRARTSASEARLTEESLLDVILDLRYALELSLGQGFRSECVYKEPENVKWLMEQDWIVDYDEYVKMPLAELEALQERLKAERSAGIDEFNAKDEAYREAHYDEESDKFDKLGHKIASFGDLIEFRKGEFKFVFPDEYRGKTAISDASSATSTPQKKPGFFARLFGRGAQ